MPFHGKQRHELFLAEKVASDEYNLYCEYLQKYTSPGLESTEAHQCPGLSCPFDWPQCPSPKSVRPWTFWYPF